MSESKYKCELGHEQKTGMISMCATCFVARENQRMKLLEFVKELESYNINFKRPTDYEQGAQDKSLVIADLAKKLLNEIGEA